MPGDLTTLMRAELRPNESACHIAVLSPGNGDVGRGTRDQRDFAGSD